MCACVFVCILHKIEAVKESISLENRNDNSRETCGAQISYSIYILYTRNSICYNVWIGVVYAGFEEDKKHVDGRS